MVGDKARYIDFNQEGQVPFEQWLGELRIELDQVAGDRSAPRNAAFAQAASDSLETPEMTNSLAVLHTARPDRTGPESYRMMRTAFGALLLERPGFVYAGDYVDPKDFADGFRWVYGDPGLTDRLNTILSKETLHTNIWQRYVVELIMGLALRHTVTNPNPTRVDVGCSTNLGNKYLLLGRDFEDVQVLVKPSGGKTLEVSADKTGILNKLLRTARPMIPRVTGIDRVNVAESVKPELIEASFTPDEIAKGSMPKRHRELAEAQIRPGLLSFFRADITVAEDVRALRDVMGGEVDVVSAIASMYQNSSSRIKRGRDRIRDMLHPDGYAYFFDFLNLAQDSGGQYLARMRRWDKMNLIAYRRRTRRLDLVASFASGRARAARFYPAFGELAAGGPFEDIAKELSA